MLVTSSTFKGIFQTCRFLKCVSFHRCPSPEEAATVWAQRPILGDLQCCPRLVQWFSDQLSDSGQTGGLCLRLPHDRSWLPAGKPADFYCSEKSWMNLFESITRAVDVVGHRIIADLSCWKLKPLLRNVSRPRRSITDRTQSQNSEPTMWFL